VTLTRPVASGAIIGWADVRAKDDDATRYRRAMEEAWRQRAAA